MTEKDYKQIVLDMVETFKKVPCDQLVNVSMLYDAVTGSFDGATGFYWDFHEERKRQGIKIKRPSNRRRYGLATGVPDNVDMFYRLPFGEEEIESEYNKALNKYIEKFHEDPHLTDDVCDAILKPKEQLITVLNYAVKTNNPNISNKIYIPCYPRDDRYHIPKPVVPVFKRGDYVTLLEDIDTFKKGDVGVVQRRLTKVRYEVAMLRHPCDDYSEESIYPTARYLEKIDIGPFNKH